jgi:glyceraldehyde-3-phosphate dehydrogenase (NADP+) (phosphorylating)
MAAASLSIAIVPSCSSASVVKAASCSASSSCSQVAFSKGFSDFSGFKSTSCATFGKSSDDLALRVAAQTAVAANSGQKKAIVEAKIKVAINGFGRIGRNFIRCWHGRKDSPLEIVVINDTGGVKQASHLLKYDSMLGTFDADVKVAGNDGISVDGKIIKVVSDRNPLNLPWG